jgi:two-component system NarL family response regulator
MRLLIVEDNSLLLQNLNLLLSGEAGFKVVGACETAEEALGLLPKVSPEILLVDLGLPGMSGIELIRRAKAMMPDLDIMAYTVFEDKNTIFSAIKAGASGYLLKGTTPRELIESIVELYHGGAPMSPNIARSLITEFQSEDDDGQSLLSNREKDVLRHLGKGMTYKEMAESMNISIHTVHTHIKNIYEKLQARNQQEAVLKARKKGIL